MWFGTTIAGLLTRARRRCSIADVAMMPVLPAPTAWNSPTAGSLTIRVTASTWCGRGSHAVAMPGSVRVTPTNERGT